MASSLFKNMGLNRTLCGITTSYSPICASSVYASLFAAVAVTGCLFAERGDFIQVPMASALVDALVYNGQVQAA